MRSPVAVLLGVMSAMIVFWIGGIIAQLNMYGIAQGSQGGPPTTVDFIAHLAAAVAAAFCGTALAVRVAQRSPAWHASAVIVVLAVIMIQGFGTATSTWPPWFGFAVAAACAAGGALAAAQASAPRG